MKIGLGEKSACIISSIESNADRACLALIRHFSNGDGGSHRPVFFFHGATVPTLMTSADRINGVSWFDVLALDGQPVYGLDLRGYGESDPYPDSSDVEPADPRDYGSAQTLMRDIDKVVDVIRTENEVDKLQIIAISRGVIPAGYYPGAHPEKIQSITFHGPITRQSGLGAAVIEKYFGRPSLPKVSHFALSARDRFNLLRDDRPAGAPSPLIR